MRFSRSPFAAALLIGGAALTLSACGSEKAPAAPTPDSKTAATTTDAAPAKAPATAAPAKAGAPDLSAYVGKYPFDKVDGVAFGDHPLVKAGIAATVTDARVRTAITATAGPSAPIEMIDGKVASWACQQHKCGEHQWTVLVDPATGATDVCYVNDPAMTNESRWFLAGGKEEKRKGDCAAEKN
ncbi:hypothetical protein SAMN05428974_1844 [Sphingopyxis sp. YR583]|jgi:hypothetical protein|uniref:hypothetical protein n=1 Tax=Sphingopyxis sp. YR583 TaxID=1881047 RepID=UPI0008A7A6F4|nr:hypothetical protein [Sphingopyxis sp. YR583]SEH16723.1 hypothetical protein SAMN05428974_1844 [Sphingopyxis sp. YR583]